MSQREFARHMQSAGFEKWSHLTVSGVESGRRPLRLTETLAAAKILGTSINVLAGLADDEDLAPRLAQANQALTAIKRLAVER